MDLSYIVFAGNPYFDEVHILCSVSNDVFLTGKDSGWVGVCLSMPWSSFSNWSQQNKKYSLQSIMFQNEIVEGSLSG